MEQRQPWPGAIALVGSGEYTAAMEQTDRLLLDTLGGPQAARVAVLPTASGLEPGMPAIWNERGVRHFRVLGAAVTPVPLVERVHAFDPAVVAALQQANFFYFSGGNPEYVVATLSGTPAWEAISSGQRAGAVLAGCSAGAMLLGSHTLRVRAVAQGQPPQWLPAMGVVPGLVVMPHFDRIGGFVGPEVFRQIVASAPQDNTLVGIDEDTALVRIVDAQGTATWHATGRQTVSLFDQSGERLVYAAGSQVALRLSK